MSKKKFRALLTQGEIAIRTQVSQTMVHFVLNGDRIPSPILARRLEEGTGICRQAWVFPEICWNPYMPFADARVCGPCLSRKRRFPVITEKSIEAVKLWPTVDGLKNCLEIIQIYNNWPDGVYYSFYKITDAGLELLAASADKREPKLFTNEKFPYLNRMMRQRWTIAMPYIQENILKNIDNEISESEVSFILTRGFKSVYAFPGKKLVTIAAYCDVYCVLDTEGEAAGITYTRELEKHLREI